MGSITVKVKIVRFRSRCCCETTQKYGNVRVGVTVDDFDIGIIPSLSLPSTRMLTIGTK